MATSKLHQHYASIIRKLQELVHEVNLHVASYRHAVQNVGTQSDSMAGRRELDTIRKQCLRTCENNTNAVLPQLKSETHEGLQSSEFTKQASQFIGCLSAFVTEMRRYQSLLITFPVPAEHSVMSGDSEPTISRVDGEHQQQLASLCRDINEAEIMLETLENLITVHFSTKDQPGDKVEPPRRRAKSCRLDCICSNFKTSYA